MTLLQVSPEHPSIVLVPQNKHGSSILKCHETTCKRTCDEPSPSEMTKYCSENVKSLFAKGFLVLFPGSELHYSCFVQTIWDKGRHDCDIDSIEIGE
jgi:hypothetical protein